MSDWKEKYRRFKKVQQCVNVLRRLNSEVRGRSPPDPFTETHFQKKDGSLDHPRLAGIWWDETLAFYEEFPQNQPVSGVQLTRELAQLFLGNRRVDSECLGEATSWLMQVSRVPSVLLNNSDCLTSTGEFGNGATDHSQPQQFEKSNPVPEAADWKQAVDQLRRRVSKMRRKEASHSTRSRPECPGFIDFWRHFGSQAPDLASFNLRASRRRKPQQAAVGGRLSAALHHQAEAVWTINLLNFRETLHKIRKRMEAKKFQAESFSEKHRAWEVSWGAQTEVVEMGIRDFPLSADFDLFTWLQRCQADATLRQFAQSVEFWEESSHSLKLIFEPPLYSKPVAFSHTEQGFELWRRFLVPLLPQNLTKNFHRLCHNCRNPPLTTDSWVCGQAHKETPASVPALFEVRANPPTDPGMVADPQTPQDLPPPAVPDGEAPAPPHVIPVFPGLLNECRQRFCKRIYCEECLFRHYELTMVDGLFICPFCLNSCLCPRCLTKKSLAKTDQLLEKLSVRLNIPFSSLSQMVSGLFRRQQKLTRTIQDQALATQESLGQVLSTRPPFAANQKLIRLRDETANFIRRTLDIYRLVLN